MLRCVQFGLQRCRLITLLQHEIDLRLADDGRVVLLPDVPRQRCQCRQIAAAAGADDRVKFGCLRGHRERCGICYSACSKHAGISVP